MRFTNTLITCVIPFAIVGCQSAPQYSAHPMDSVNSYAFNVANQTPLTKNNSPLKDYSLEELDKVRKEKERKSNTAKRDLMLGVADTLLTGNLWGIATGSVFAATSGYKADHTASKSQWIIALDADKFTSAKEAQSYAEDKIRNAAISVLTNKGNTLVQHEMLVGFTGYTTQEDPTYRIGIAEKVDESRYLKPLSFEKAKTNLIKSESQYVSTEMFDITALSSINYMPIIKGKIHGYTSDLDGYEQYLKDLTTLLPENFYLYIPPMPKENEITVSDASKWNQRESVTIKPFVLTANTAPAIYHQGVKHEFIKPELD